MLVASGDLKESKIRFHEDRNKLLKVLGDSSREIQPDLSDPISIEESTSFLLCTDGFWEWIDERQIQKFAKKSKTANEWVNDMGKYVITCGKGKNMDNATAITVRL